MEEEIWEDVTEWQLSFVFEEPKVVDWNETHCNCIVCNKGLYNVMRGEAFQPMGGTAFKTYGHYGSTVFDPLDGSSLEIVICDECLDPRMPDDRLVFEHPYKKSR